MKLSYFTFKVDDITYGEFIKDAFTISELTNGDIVSSDLIFEYRFLELKYAKLRVGQKKKKFKLGDYKWKQK
ncbi:MAG: hypothetical protein ACTSWD_04830 [Candidatus Heimdallarchaeota archaeon]